MILFFSFAPINFRGGFELWLEQMFYKTATYEKTFLINVHPRLANKYGNLVLSRKFSREDYQGEKQNHILLEYKHFIPFTEQWRTTKNLFCNSRIIYIKLELLEIAICFYFGDFRIFKKIVGGIHSPLYYSRPKSLLGKLHNLIYSSPIYEFIISHIKKIHVLNKRDEMALKNKFHIDNIIRLYDGVEIPKNIRLSKKHQNNKSLNIITVGELSLRKGTDILCKIIELAPINYFFSIVGDGPYREVVKKIKNKENCKYYGYVQDKLLLNKLYKQNDVLLFPSRAETQGLVIPEAMNYGLRILVSKEVSLSLPNNIESIANEEKPQEYLDLLKKMLAEKKHVNKHNIHFFAYEEFSRDKIDPIFLNKILEIN